MTKTISAAQKVAVAALPLTDSSNLFSFSLSMLDFNIGKLSILDLYFEFDAVFIVIIIRNPLTDNKFTAIIKLANRKSLLEDIFNFALYWLLNTSSLPLESAFDFRKCTEKCVTCCKLKYS